ncbi:MAG: M56 family metallopeptidase, partial [Salinimicrobium sp.]
IIRVSNSNIACTYFNTIFLGDQLSEEEAEQILSHELVHVKQKHSLDLVYFEVQKILFWFNPLIYIYQSRLSVLHEYIADAGVVKKVEKQRYFQQLLNAAFDSRDISFINQFYNKSIIKKRIIMLQRNRSRTVSKLKYLILFPMMLLMLIYVSGTEVMAQEKQNPHETIQKSVTNVPFAVVEEVPVYPGCENLEIRQEKMECFSKNITNFVNTNFDTDLGKKLGLKGLNRVYVRFKISASGEIEDVESRASHPALGEEAERVIKLLPKMQPGKNRGEKVAVMYALPINFMVPEPDEEEQKKD